MNEEEFVPVVKVSEIDNFVYNGLIELGYAPTKEESEDIVDIFLTFLQLTGLASIGQMEGDMEE